jgi:SAM-dependent methyltransferase
MSFYSRFASYYESVFPFSQGVYTLLRHHMPALPAAVLDVGCGTGHYAGVLAEEGYEAVGVDLDAGMVAYAQSHYPGAMFHVMNMLDIGSLGRVFGGIFCIGNTAAHLNRAQFSGFLDQVQGILAPGGSWVLQVMNWDYVLTQESVTLPLIEAEGGIVFRRAYRDISEAQVTFETRLEVNGEVIFEDATPLYPLRSDDIVALHDQRGFHLAAHQGSYDGAPFDPARFSANIFVFHTTAKP